MADPLLPLRGARILDLSRYLPGPYLTRLLADLGADVLKIEDPHGDPARYLPPMAGESGAAFAALNWGKRSLVIDLKQDAGRELLLALVAKSDVLVETFRPGVLDRLGVGWHTLHATNPRLVLCSISGYGQNTTLRDEPGHDLNYVARAGVLSLFGPAGAVPVVPGVPMADIGAGALKGAVGVLAALLERETTGSGRHLDVSMTRGMTGFGAFEHARRATQEAEPRGAGMLTGGRPCYRVYQTRDGKYMTLAALEPKFFEAFCQRAECPQLIGKGLTVGDEGGQVTAELERMFASRTQTEWVELLAGSGSCCEPVRSIEEAAVDPGVNAPTVEVDGHTYLVPHVGAPQALPEAASVPALGEHGREVVDELDIDETLVRRAIECGALLEGNA